MREIPDKNPPVDIAAVQVLIHGVDGEADVPDVAVFHLVVLQVDD